MLILPLIFVLAALALALVLRKPKTFGGAKREIERRRPELPLADEDELEKRRKDDNVGGEGG